MVYGLGENRSSTDCLEGHLTGNHGLTPLNMAEILYIYSVESWEQDWFVSNVGESGESPKISWYDITAGKSISMSTFDH